MYSALCTERDLRLPMSYSSIEDTFVMKSDSLFLEVVGTQLLHFFLFERVNSMSTSISGK